MRIQWIAFVPLWLSTVVGVLAMLASYDKRPDSGAKAPAGWPKDSRLDRADGRPTLVMVLHPRCDRSRASVAELAELMTRATVRPRAYVAILRPSGLSEGWDETGIRHAATRIPGVKVIRDDGGREARFFGADTSGQTYLYDADGRLIFSGGITSARGQAGESVGRTAILSLLNDKPSSNGQSAAGADERFVS